MYTCVWLLYLSLVAVLTSPELLQLDDLTQMCPYNDFCVATARRNLLNIFSNVPCCLPCSCSKFCWARGDCCFDVPTPPPANIAELQDAVGCVTGSHTFVDGQRVALHKEATHMWMITKCIDTAATNEFAAKCQLSPDSSIFDLVPVWSPSTRDLFRNMYCAMCYDVTDYVFLFVDIAELNGYMDVEQNASWDLIDYLLRDPAAMGHVLTVYAANDTALKMPHCNVTVVSNCPSNASIYGEVLKDKCAELSNLYMRISDKANDTNMFFVDLFNNIYCYLCNIDYRPYNETHGSNAFMDEECPSGIKLHTSSLSDNIPDFAALIVLSEDSSEDIKQTCSKTDIPDPYMVGI